MADYSEMMSICRLSNRTNLSYSTCAELLKAGWTYKEEVNEPAIWLAPLYKLKEIFNG